MNIRTQIRKNGVLISAGVLIALAAVGSWYIFTMPLQEDRYNKVMCYYIARNCTANADTAEKKIGALQDFVHSNIHPIHGYENRDDTKAIDKFISGIGWCDQQARAFMQLARAIGIDTRLLFLHSQAGPSPHSVAEARLPDGRWVIVDSLFNLTLRNKKGALATQQDIKEDPAIVTDNEKIKLRKPYDPKWSDPNFLSVYYNPPRYVVEKRGVSIDLLKFVPLSWIRCIDKCITDIRLFRLREKGTDGFELKMAKARAYHLLGYLKESESLYHEIVGTSKDPLLVNKAEYFMAMSMIDQKKYSQSMAFIEDTIRLHSSNPYKDYLVGLMGRILAKTGKTAEASKKQEQIGYMLRAM